LLTITPQLLLRLLFSPFFSSFFHFFFFIFFIFLFPIFQRNPLTFNSFLFFLSFSNDYNNDYNQIKIINLNFQNDYNHFLIIFTNHFFFFII